MPFANITLYFNCLLFYLQSVGLGGAQRKLAEELYQPLKPCPDENSGYSSSFLFVRSTDLQIRMLSYLTLLRTLSQGNVSHNALSWQLMQLKKLRKIVTKNGIIRQLNDVKYDCRNRRHIKLSYTQKVFDSRKIRHFCLV